MITYMELLIGKRSIRFDWPRRISKRCEEQRDLKVNIVRWWNWIDTPTPSGLSAIYRFESCPDYYLKQIKSSLYKEHNPHPTNEGCITTYIMKDALGDRMKEFYEDRTRIKLPRRTFTICLLYTSDAADE